MHNLRFDCTLRNDSTCKKISGQTYTATTGYNAKGELTSYTYPDGMAVGSYAAIVARYGYWVYGVPTITNATATVLPVGSVNNRYMYTGREWDSVIAQYHYRARMYDANLGRIASRDPIGFAGSPWNAYRYVHCAPTNWEDPSGLLEKPSN